MTRRKKLGKKKLCESYFAYRRLVGDLAATLREGKKGGKERIPGEEETSAMPFQSHSNLLYPLKRKEEKKKRGGGSRLFMTSSSLPLPLMMGWAW